MAYGRHLSGQHYYRTKKTTHFLKEFHVNKPLRLKSHIGLSATWTPTVKHIRLDITLHNAAIDVEVIYFWNFNCYVFLNGNWKDIMVGMYLFCKTASLIVWSRLLDAAAKLRTLSIQLPGRLCKDLPISRSGILDREHINTVTLCLCVCVCVRNSILVSWTQTENQLYLHPTAAPVC